jgi:hypothetical protein
VKKQRWEDLSPAARRGIVAAGVVQLTLFATAQLDLHRRAPREVRGQKRWWRLALFVNFLGPLAYFAYGRR